MSAHEISPGHTLSETVASMGSALLKTLPSRRIVQDRSNTEWGDIDAFSTFDAGDLAQARQGSINFAEMTS